MSDLTDYRDDIRIYLEREDLVLIRIGESDDYAVRGKSRRAFWYRPFFTLPADLLAEYLQKDPPAPVVSGDEMTWVADP